MVDEEGNRGAELPSPLFGNSPPLRSDPIGHVGWEHQV